MKNIIAVLSLILIVYATAVEAQSCLPEGITFTRQEQIDNFQTDYPGCTEIEGSVEISGWGISSLYGLNAITSIGGLFVIYDNYALTSLTGLEGLISIGGSFRILANDALTSMAGLEGLTTIGGDLNITDNDGLISLAGLEGLTSIGRHLNITDNDSLTSLDGIDNIDPDLIGDVSVYSNPQLSTCDVQSICSYFASPNGAVNIYNNANGCNNPVEIATACGFNMPCLPFGNYYFLSQNDIDNFQTDYTGCTEIEGDIFIGERHSSNDITNLSGLGTLTSVGGSLHIFGTNSLISLAEFESITSIGGYLEIFKNSALTSLEGLEGVTSIGHGISINHNSALTSLTGLEGVTSNFGYLMIDDNYTLTSLAGLEGLTSIGGQVGIHNNSALTSLAGLEGVTSIGGYLSITNNDGLTSMAGLEGLTSIGTDLRIMNNDGLTSLTGLESVTSIGGYFRIRNNDALNSLEGINNIEAISIDRLYITDNIDLSECEVKSICDYLIASYGPIIIRDNALGCNTRAEVEKACASSINKMGFIDEFIISPSPFTTSTTIAYELKQPSSAQLSVFNQLGQLVYQHSEKQTQGIQKLQWDAQDQPEGLYYYQLQAGDQQATGKLVKIR